MAGGDEFEQWLQAQPLDEPVEIDGESVYLKVRPKGAELGVFLIHSYTQSQLRDALKQGFNSARQYDAGLGRTPDGNNLVLNQWLPHVSGWSQAVLPMENLLNQVSMWRASLVAPKVIKMESMANRNEQRLRMMVLATKP
jgi:hypothetical protein